MHEEKPMKRFEPQEGDKGRAWHDDLGCMVEIVYRRQWFRYLPEDVDVFTLVGVYEPTGEALLIPPQSAPDIGAAIQARDAAGGRAPVASL